MYLGVGLHSGYGNAQRMYVKRGLIPYCAQWVKLAFSRLLSSARTMKTGRVGSKEEVDRLTEGLRKDGFRVVSNPRTTGDGYYESCLIDFEENQIEITI